MAVDELISSNLPELFSPTRSNGVLMRSGLYNPFSPAWPMAHSLPWFTGWFGLPSIFLARPSRVRTMMPQPASHCRQTLLYQVAIPGVKSSGAVTCGIRYSTASFLLSANRKPTLVPTPPAPIIFRKSLRFMRGICFWSVSVLLATCGRSSNPGHFEHRSRCDSQRRTTFSVKKPG